jgi:hypothetical protein
MGFFLYTILMKYFLKVSSLIFLICMFPLICACSGRSGGSNWAAADFGQSTALSAPSTGSVQRERAAQKNILQEEAEENPQASGAENAEQTRKLVKRAELRIRVDDPGATEKPLTDLLEKYNAWTASTGIYENSRNYSIRVPSAFYDAMLAELADLGRILWRTENAEDVTLRYYDLESRLATQRELLRTYQSYLSRASNINDIMSVESRIADLQQEIDHTGTQFRNLASLVDYSTIFIDITGPVSAASYSRPPLGERLSEVFGSFGDIASSALVVFIGIIIYGVPSILIIILLFWLLFGRIGILKKLWRLAAGRK